MTKEDNEAQGRGINDEEGRGQQAIVPSCSLTKKVLTIGTERNIRAEVNGKGGNEAQDREEQKNEREEEEQKMIAEPRFDRGTSEL